MLRKNKLIGYEKGDLAINGYVVAQVQNPPLIVALIAMVASWILADGTAGYLIARAVLYMGLTIWAYLELAVGGNGFRKLLGAGALIWIVFSLKNELG